MARTDQLPPPPKNDRLDPPLVLTNYPGSDMAETDEDEKQTRGHISATYSPATTSSRQVALPVIGDYE